MMSHLIGYANANLKEKRGNPESLHYLSKQTVFTPIGQKQ